MSAKNVASSRLPDWPRYVFLFFYGAGAAVLLARLYVMWAIGGTSWQQADWLINFADGPVRRGLSGELFFLLSDITGIELIALVCAVQALLVLIVFWGVTKAMLRIGVTERLLLIALSPAFLMFWVYDPLAGLRKELLGYLAFLPLLACAAGHAKPDRALKLSFAIYLVSVVFHEVNGFLAPFLLAGYALCLDGIKAKRTVVLWGCALAVVALAGLVFAFAYPDVSSNEIICAPVLARGGSPEICSGIFTWLEMDATSHRQTALNFVENSIPIVAVFSFLVISLPTVVAFWRAPARLRYLAIYFASVLPLLPLYIMTVDWGRWIALQISALTFLALIYFLQYRSSWLQASVHRLPLAFSLLICGFYGFSHVWTGPIPGTLLEIAKVVIDPSVLKTELLEQP